MARAQTWARNISKKGKKLAVSGSIVNNDALEGLKRRAEDLGLIIHARAPKPRRTSGKSGKK
jgi:predicted HAD superfamily phosphohydrolase YqeG